MDNEFSFLSLLLITGLAAFVPLLASRFKKLRIPIVVGEIIAGMIFGKSGLNWIEPSPALEFLTLFGFTYLMFLSGLEVDFDIISGNATNGERRRLFENPVTLGLAVFALTTGIALVAAEMLLQFDLIQDPFIIALILSTTSLGIVVPVLKERGLMASQYGQSLLMSALVADFGTLVLIAIDVAILSQGITLDVLLVFILLAAFAAAVQTGRLAARIAGLPRLIEELSHATAQIRVRGAMALMIAFIVLSEWLGSELILGAFLAGAVISLLSPREGSQLHIKMEAIGFGFFIPIFFIMVGVQFDLPALLGSTEALLLVPLLLTIAYMIKFVASLLYRLNFSWRETMAAGSLLSSRLSLIIAAAAIALELGIINEAVDSAIILVAIVTSIVSPLLFSRILPPQAAATRQGTLLTGLGEMPVLLAKRLVQAGTQVTVVGLNRGRKRGSRRQELPVLEGDPADPQVLAKAGAASAKALVAASTNDEINLKVCQLAAQEFNIPELVAYASDDDIAAQMHKLGVRVIRPQLATILSLESALHFPAAFDMLTNHADGVEVREVELNNARFDGRPVRQIRLPGDALILAIRRNGEVLVPHGNTRLRQGDLLMLVGHRDSLAESLNQLAP
jgi:Kef-type K+ transport system membrane component KefB/K+/H+ antiporter YhaU regulatory subunit KhtT